MKSSFTIERTIRAPITEVFEAFTDHRGYADKTPVRKSTLDREGLPAPNGVGAVRRLELAYPPIVEEVVEYEKPTRFAYKAVSGLPVSEHLGKVVLTESGGNTHMRYTVGHTAAIPGGEVVVGPVLKQAVGALIRGIVKSVE